MIAEVIVDVPAKQTDRLFDYEIPKKWETMIQAGMRVLVPFGPRLVQGFVVSVKETSEYGHKTKPIHSLLDVTPVLNEELLQLGSWLTETTLCFMISALQAMLPAAMRAKYDKEIQVIDKQKISQYPELQTFTNQSSIPWSEIENSPHLKLIQRLIQQKVLEVVYLATEKGKKKTAKYIELAIPISKALEYLQSLPKQAKKQQEMLQFFIDRPEKILRAEILSMANASKDAINSLLKKEILLEKELEVYRDPYEHRLFQPTNRLVLTEQQQVAYKTIVHSVIHKEHQVVLMYGVTGSGKTEVYMQAADEVLKQGKEAIVLVPEISLTPQMVDRFKGRFGSQVAVLHSRLSTGEKYDEWRRIHRKEVKLVVGARSAIFAPFENLGIVIIDEEHEASYKQEENPRYHAKDVAIFRGKFHKCPVVLGSATPSLESFARAKKNIYTLVTLNERMNTSGMPPVEIVDMREELRAENRTMFSRVLFSKLQDRLEKGEQTVLFLNKRGYSSFVMCRDCGYVIECPHCDISLTYHRAEQKLKCHYCGFEEPVVKKCPSCDSEHIRFFGVGTQQVEEQLSQLLPEARVVRMDVDTTGRKGSHERLLDQFGSGSADILLGTQMIAKGLDFPRVTLVGVLSADTSLYLPDFRAAEKTFQLLTQVSGRAGRHELAGEVIIQTYNPEHYSITLASQHDYDTFYEQEMRVRKAHHYVPFYYLTLITISHPEVTRAVMLTDKIISLLKSQLSSEAIILGPVASPIAKVKDRYRYQCVVKYKREPNFTTVIKSVLDHYQQEMAQGLLLITIDLNPYMMM